MSAQTPEKFDRFLVPVVAFHQPGAHGSIWTTEVHALNRSIEDKIVAQDPDAICQIECPSQVVRAREAAGRELFRPAGNQGVFLYVEKPSDLVDLTLRVTEAADGWGVRLPIVSFESFARTIRLVNLPTDERFRITIRVYDFEGKSEVPVTVRVRAFGGSDQVIAERALRLDSRHGRTDTVSERFAPYPADIGVSMADLLSGIADRPERIWLEIESEDPIWSFASVTDNVTQRVTIITP